MMIGGEMAPAGGWDPWRQPLVELDAAMGRHSPVLQEILRHPSRDAFWDRVDMTPTLAEVRIPVLHWGGWYDVILQGTLLGWEQTTVTRERGAGGAEQRLIIGPTDHARLPAVYGADGTGGEDAPGGWCFDHTQRFFDCHLRGEADALIGVAPVRVYVMGAERWRRRAPGRCPRSRPSSTTCAAPARPIRRPGTAASASRRPATSRPTPSTTTPSIPSTRGWRRALGTSPGLPRTAAPSSGARTCLCTPRTRSPPISRSPGRSR